MQMVSFNRVNSALSSYNQRLSTADFASAAPTVLGEYNAKLTSTVGKTVGQKVNGFEAISQLEDYSGQLGDNLFGLATVALTSEVEGFLDTLIENIEDAFTNLGGGHAEFTDVLTALGTLAVLTGTNPGSAFLKSYYGGSSSNAMAVLLSKATGKNVSQLLSTVETLQSAGSKQFVQAAFGRVLSEVLNPIIAEFNKKVDLNLGTAIDKVLQAIVDVVDSPVALIINDLTGGKLLGAELNNAIRLLSNGQYAEAILLVSQNSNEPYSVIEERLLNIDTKISTRITYTGSTTLPVFDIGSNANGWEGVATTTITNRSNASSPINYNFTRLGGVQELEADMRSATRDISETVIHWSATYLDQDIGSEEIHGWHRQRGFSGIGYHYVIRRDGTIERGRPINITGAHAKANGHNNLSIGVCLVGGYTVPSAVGLRNPPAGSESFTEAQTKTMNEFLNTFYKVFPGGQVFGHNDTDPNNKIDPGFDVSKYIRNTFNKSNVTIGTSQPLSPAQIAQARANNVVS